MDTENYSEDKTSQVAILSILVFFLGLFVFLAKVDACHKTFSCQESFHSTDNWKMDKELGIHNDVISCENGAKIEQVEGGYICRCPVTTTPPR